MNPYKGLKNIPRNVWLLSAATLINRSGTMVIPFLTIYMIKEIGVSASAAGMVLLFYGFGALVTAPLVGKLSDKIGSLKVMRISLVLTGLLLFAYSFVKDYYTILGVTLVWSIISEAFRPANLSMLSFESKPEQRKTSFSLNRLAINLGMSIGPVIGGFLSQVNYSLLFYVNGTTSILAGIFLILAKFEKHETAKPFVESDKEESTNEYRFAILRDKRFLIYVFALVPVCLVFFQFLGGLPLYIIKELHYSESAFGLLMAVNTVLIIIIEVPLNNAMENWDDRHSLVLGSLLATVGFGCMGISGNIYFLIGAIIIWTFGEMIFFPSAASYTAKISPDERRGEYMGYFQMTFSFSLMLGPWLGAIIFDNYGSKILWSISFIVGLISVFAFVWMKKKFKK